MKKVQQKEVNDQKCISTGGMKWLPVLMINYGSQVAERLRNRASNQKVSGSISHRANDIVSLGKALHPTCLGGMSLYSG